MFGNPGDTLSLTGDEIAAAIGADITGQAVRLVDNKPVSYTGGANLTSFAADVPALVLADVSAAVCITVNATNIGAPQGSTPLVAGWLGFDLRFDWFDATGTTKLYSEVYELLCVPHAPIGQSVVTQWQATLPCRGAKLSVTATNPMGVWAGGVAGGFALRVDTSSRVIPTAIRGYTDQASFDGMLLDHVGAPLAASASINLIGAPAGGRVFLAFLGSTQQMRFDVGWGLQAHGLLRDVRTWAAINNSSGMFEFPATNRPINVLVANLAAAGASYNVSAWTAPNP